MKRQKITPKVVGKRRYFEAATLDSKWQEKELNRTSLHQNCCNNIIAIANNSIRGYHERFARSLALYQVNHNWELIVIDSISQTYFKYFLVKEIEKGKGNRHSMKMKEAECNDFQLVNIFLPKHLQELFASFGKKIVNPACVVDGYVVLPDNHFSSRLLSTGTAVKETTTSTVGTPFVHFKKDYNQALPKEFHTFYLCPEKSMFPLDTLRDASTTKTSILVPEASDQDLPFFEFHDLKIFTRTFHLLLHRDFQRLKEDVANPNEATATHYHKCLRNYSKRRIDLLDFDSAMINNNVRFIHCTQKEWTEMEKICKGQQNFTTLTSPSGNNYIYTYNNFPNIKLNGKYLFFSFHFLPPFHLTFFICLFTGTFVSSFSIPLDSKFPIFSINEVTAIESFLNGTRGFGSRSCSPCIATNLYLGPRGSRRPQLSPFIRNPQVNMHQDYFRQSWQNQLTQIRLVLKLHFCSDQALKEATVVNRTFLKFVGLDESPRIIYTSGNHDDLSFSNYPHTDDGDQATQELINQMFTFPDHYKNNKSFIGALRYVQKGERQYRPPASYYLCSHYYFTTR